MDFLENDPFRNISTQPQTPDQGQAPSCADKSIRYSQQLDKNLGIKETTFMASSPYRLTGYSAVQTQSN